MADYCVDGDSRSETSIHLDVRCRRACYYVFSVSDCWMFSRQFVWKVRGVESSGPMSLDKSIAGEARFVDHQHSTSSFLPPRECLPFLHARKDLRRLNAELHCSLHRTRILWLDSMCLHWSWSLGDFLFRVEFVCK